MSSFEKKDSSYEHAKHGNLRQIFDHDTKPEKHKQMWSLAGIKRDDGDDVAAADDNDNDYDKRCDLDHVHKAS